MEHTMAADHTILLTGASSGIGKATAMTLARRGHRVFAAMRDLGGRNRAAADELTALAAQHPIEVVEIDVSSDASVAAGVEQALRTASHIDVLVNCAGIMWLGVTEAFTTEQFKRILDTNLLGPFRMLRAVLPHMRARNSGLLITVTSTAGRTWPPGFGIYSASKAAMEALAEIIGYEVAPFGIDAVIVEPGPFQTNLKASQQAPEDASVVAAYGELGDFQQRVSQAVMPLVLAAGVEKTDPQLVADSIVGFIDMPRGSRPLRATVGLDFHTADLNRAAAPHQRAFLELLGVADLPRQARSAASTR
jgi:NAD(P)-dependent dehydrogenase (short-subunit alcohol dehydrogenase family)